MKILIFVCSLVIFAQALFYDQRSIADEVNSLQQNWKAGVNQYFVNKTMEQIKHMMGTLSTPPHLQLEMREIEPLEDIPTEFFAAEAWPACESIREIRDQSICGSCWAFGAAEAISDRICIASKQKLQVRISAEDINSCCGSLCGDGCNGGYPAQAWTFYHKKGIVSGGKYNNTDYCMPYSLAPCDHHTNGSYGPCGKLSKTPVCKTQCISEYSGTYANDKWIAQSVYLLPTQISKIQTEIMTYGPVEAAFTVYSDFVTYKSGVYHHTTGSQVGGHAIKVVGWGVENGVDYWLVANSWNEEWGDKGFFKIRRGRNECGIEDNMLGGIPVLKTSNIQTE